MPQRAEAAALGVIDSELPRHLREGAVAIIAKQQVALRLVRSGVQGKRNLQPKLLRALTCPVGTGMVLDVPADVQIQISVPVVIAPGDARPEAFRRRELPIARPGGRVRSGIG